MDTIVVIIPPEGKDQQFNIPHLNVQPGQEFSFSVSVRNPDHWDVEPIDWKPYQVGKIETEIRVQYSHSESVVSIQTIYLK